MPNVYVQNCFQKISERCQVLQEEEKEATLSIYYSVYKFTIGPHKETGGCVMKVINVCAGRYKYPKNYLLSLF